MCGLTGLYDLNTGMPAEALQNILTRMTDTIVHRGPDDSGVWVDASAGIGLGFRRLSIIDLSPAGHQPMESASGRYEIAFNGEVYNAERIRAELRSAGKAPTFRGHSDTEVMLAAIEAWGLESATRRFIGMFAFALWDKQERTLALVRDRLGVKPLYYGWVGKTLLFGSELKTLCAYPDFDTTVDRNALTLMLRHAYIPSPYTIYRAARKLPPGTILTISPQSPQAAPVAYWTARSAVEQGLADTFTGTEVEAVDQLDALLRDAVGLRMVADVPLGVFLSGGVDSSTVVALMQAQSTRPVKTFSIGFHEDEWNEAQYAKEVAKHLGTDHTELYVTAQEALDVIPRLPALYDEPFADASQIPTFLVSELARRSVTVSLSGDGGDELFGGYTRYLQGVNLWKKMAKMPRPVRVAGATGMKALSPQTWDRVSRALPGRLQQRQLGEKMAKVSELLDATSQDGLYRSLVSQWKNPADVVRDGREPLTALTAPDSWPNLDLFTLRMMYLDTVSYLPDDILVKVDRASMGVSLEAREPLLDHRVLEFAWRLPLDLKVRDGKGKWPLRQVLYRYVPPALIDRPKAGFGVPIDSWLRGPLRDWAEDLLSETRLRREGFLQPQPIRKKWQEHLSGRCNWQYHLWNVLMFQAWNAANSHR